MSDIIPTFTDDDTAYSWLQRVNISNRDLLYEYCGDEMEKEFSLLRSEWNRNIITGFYFFLGNLLKEQEDTLDARTIQMIQSQMTEIANRYISEKTKDIVNRLLSWEITITDA
jgi:hypothetical protein